ncbi:phosphoribosylglycinamide formyltransferase [Sulfurimonas marina]|uniref:phosphoribosylglycinamide formyltransferase 1 n=1 Tax=Sulfurimonas marina TaxID=2590551 RepID=A0A7M1AZK4_9BACT|nr:phosphoribosylglycinamide formyltransferase [Sulfurimonas marina]QOP41802.1 phosphoribosylglycinamide formyltransferase [Sulfurimonas marina]
MTKIAILASHNGSNLDPIYEAIQENKLDAAISLVISNNTDANVLKKAQKLALKNHLINAKTVNDPDQSIYDLCSENEIDMIVLSGYMKKLSSALTRDFNIINSHPSLLPKYGGSGMYGRFVHEAVIANSETKSGVSIHFVNEEYDEGKIILQKELLLTKDETPISLEARVKELEKQAIVEALETCLR